MLYFFAVLTVLGWAWTAGVLLWASLRWSRLRQQEAAAGFDVVVGGADGKQSKL